MGSGNISAALRDAGYDVREIDVKRDIPALVDALTPPPDIVYNALHGPHGEDGGHVRQCREKYDFGEGRTFEVWREAGYWTGHIEASAGWPLDDMREFMRVFRAMSEDPDKGPWQIALPQGDRAPESLRRLFARHGLEAHIRWPDYAEVWTRPC